MSESSRRILSFWGGVLLWVALVGAMILIPACVPRTLPPEEKSIVTKISWKTGQESERFYIVTDPENGCQYVVHYSAAGVAMSPRIQPVGSSTAGAFICR